MIAGLKYVLMFLGLAFGMQAAFERFTDLGFTPSLLFFIGLLSIAIAGYCAGAFTHQPLVRWFWAIVFAACASFQTSFEFIMEDELSYDSFLNMWQSRGFIGDAFGQHGASLFFGFIHSVIVLLAVGLKPPVIKPLWQKYIGLVPVIAIIAISSVFYARGGNGGKGLPGFIVTPSYFTILTVDTLMNPSKPRQTVTLKRTAAKPQADIVLIIDESISGQYLDINGQGGVYSGLGKPRDGFGIHNFGLASSITHCSMGTNLTLRFGGTQKDYARINAEGPSIWSYAKTAGLSTVYIDAQRTDGAYQNGMTDEERASIDQFIQFEGVAVVDRDQAAASKLATFLNDGQAQFILVNKMGAHFPVTTKYPEGRTRYRPVGPRGEFGDQAEAVARDVFKPDPKRWQLYRNAYRNALEWNVGAFFDRLLSEAKPSDAVILYTSDHGQDLHERGNPGSATHCEPHPTIEQGLVPLVVIDNGNPQNPWSKAAKRTQNASNHYRIFPTLLDMMGYDPAGIIKTYGLGLDKASPEPLRFNALFNARLGAEPHFVPIPLDRVVRPPQTDIANQ
jgi:glucan phosphoethanolaminetransferase (alkaline phosphatase superfamily)